MTFDYIKQLISHLAIRRSVVEQDRQKLLDEYLRELNELFSGIFVISPSVLRLGKAKTVSYKVTSKLKDYKVEVEDTSIATVDKTASTVTGVELGTTKLYFRGIVNDKDYETFIPISVENPEIIVTPGLHDITGINTTLFDIKTLNFTAQDLNLKVVGLNSKILNSEIYDTKDFSAKLKVSLVDDEYSESFRTLFTVQSGGGSVRSNPVVLYKKVKAFDSNFNDGPTGNSGRPDGYKPTPENPDPNKPVDPNKPPVTPGKPIKKVFKFLAGEGSGTMQDVEVFLAPEATELSFIIPDSTFTAPNGKRFKNWRGSNNKLYNAGDNITLPVTGDFTFTAQYETVSGNRKIKVIKFASGEGTGTMRDVEVDVTNGNTQWTIPNSGFTNPNGKTFKNWSASNGQTYTVGQTITLGNTSTLTLTAIYETATVQPTKPPVPVLKGNTKTLTLEVNDAVTLEVTNRENFTMTFEGRTDVVDAKAISANQIRVTAKSIKDSVSFDFKIYLESGNLKSDAYTVSVTVKADPALNVKKKTIKFNSGGGTGVMNDVTLTLTNGSVKYTIPNSAFSAPDKKRFKEWTGSDGKTYSGGQEITFYDEAELTLTAVYEEIPAVIKTIKFSAGDGSGSMNDVQVDITDGAKEYTIPDSTFTAPNRKRFKNWSGSDGKTYTVGQKITLGTDAELTLTAVYEQIQIPTPVIKNDTKTLTLEANQTVTLQVTNRDNYTVVVENNPDAFSANVQNDNQINIVANSIEDEIKSELKIYLESNGLRSNAYVVSVTVKADPALQKPPTPIINGNIKDLTIGVGQGSNIEVTNSGNYTVEFESNDTVTTTKRTNANTIRVDAKSIKDAVTFDLKIFLNNNGIKSDPYTISVTVKADPALQVPPKPVITGDPVKFTIGANTEETFVITNKGDFTIEYEFDDTLVSISKPADNELRLTGLSTQNGGNFEFVIYLVNGSLRSEPFICAITVNKDPNWKDPNRAEKVVKFNPGDGTGTMADITVEIPNINTGVTWTIPFSTFTSPNGKDFKSWLGSDGKTYYPGTSIIFGKGGEFTFTAVYDVVAERPKRYQTLTFAVPVDTGAFVNMFKVNGHISQKAGDTLTYGRIDKIAGRTVTVELLSHEGTKFTSAKVNNRIPALAITTGVSAGIITSKNNDEVTVQLLNTKTLFNATDKIAISGTIPTNVIPSSVGTLNDNSQTVTIRNISGMSIYDVGGFLHQGNPNTFTTDNIKEPEIVEPIPDPTKYIVIAVAGQSNSVGYDESTWDDTFRDKTNRIKQLGYYSDDNLKIIELMPCAQNIQNMSNIQDTTNNLPAGNYGVTRKGTKGIHLPLAQTLLKHIPADYGVLIVPVAYGMTGWKLGNNWLKDGTYDENKKSLQGSGVNCNWKTSGALYKTLRDRVKHALDLSPENKFAGVVWCQGETEANTNFGANIEGFKELVKQLCTDWKGYANRTELGVIDQNLFFVHETTGYWRAAPNPLATQEGIPTTTVAVDARKVWENYKAYLGDTNYVEIPINLKFTNLVNGNYPINGRNGSTSSAGASHFGNNAFRDYVAPRVAAKMVAKGVIHGVNKNTQIEIPVSGQYGDKIINYSPGTSDLALLNTGEIRYVHQYPEKYPPTGGASILFKQTVDQISLKDIKIQQLIIILESIPKNGFWCGLYFASPLVEPTIIYGKVAGKTLLEGLYEGTQGVIPDSTPIIAPRDYTKGILTISRDSKVPSRYNLIHDGQLWFTINIADSDKSIEAIGYHAVVEHTIGFMYGWSANHSNITTFATLTEAV